MTGWALRNAARDDDLTRLSALLVTGVDVDAREHLNGMNALLIAAWNGGTACLRALLAAGASVHSADEFGRQALHYASHHGCVTCIRALIAAGADVNKRYNNSTPFTLAFDHGHHHVLKILLRAGANIRRTETVPRTIGNRSAWAIVDAIRAAGGWENYVTRRRAALVRVFSGKVPAVISAHIVSFEPPGGDS